jgi:hypothetical protein
MVIGRGVAENGLVLEALAPRGWLMLAAVALGAVTFVALLVLLLVVGSNFNKPEYEHPVPPGSCYPFCAGSPPPSPPPPGWS